MIPDSVPQPRRDRPLRPGILGTTVERTGGRLRPPPTGTAPGLLRGARLHRLGPGPTAGPGYRAVTRHADVAEISRQPEIFCSGKGAVSIFDLPPEMVEYFAGMISTDNPRHARLRRIVSAAFNPRRIKSIEESIEEVADRVIDRAAGLGECDFVTEIATPLPLEIICDMMGVPPSEYGTVLHASNVILSGGDPEFIPEGNDPVLAGLEAGQRADRPDERAQRRTGSTTPPTT